MNTTENEDGFFKTGIFGQKRAVKKLIDESRADGDFYLLLSASAFITTIGLLMNNSIVIVGAMLVAPILFPILALGLGVVTDSRDAIWRAIKILFKTLAIGISISLVTTFFFSVSDLTPELDLLTNPDLLLYFFISFAAGVVASYAWVSEETAMSLPGVAISVSLVPPLSAIGVSLALFSTDLLTGSVSLFFVNLLGVVLASVIIFSFFHLNKVRAYQDKKIEEEVEEDEQAKQAATEEKSEQREEPDA
ncbi:MAG: DUF389 domain-containing protein [Candidatus Paceibacterota bacterium]